MFDEFFNKRRLEMDMWNHYMPDQPELVANEFIVMSLKNKMDYPLDFNPYQNPGFDHIGRYDLSENAIVPLECVREFSEIVPLRNAGQAIYAEALMNDKFTTVICAGPAGSGKTYMAAVYGYWACKNGRFNGVQVAPCDSRSNLGALPGNLDEKMDPDVQPIKNALRNYLLNGGDEKLQAKLDSWRKYGATSKSPRSARGNHHDDTPSKKPVGVLVEEKAEMIYSNWFKSIPIEHARGRDFAHQLAICDEFQDHNIAQADTLITRVGKKGKMIISGDVEQIHAPYIDVSNNGLVYASRLLLGFEEVVQVCFTKDEVVRHPLVMKIVMRQRSMATHPTTH